MTRLLPLACLVLALFGCKPDIGDKCSLSEDCSQAGDRLCDTTQPGGYCTVYNCEPGTCPEEASCIGFDAVESAVQREDGSWVCDDRQGGGRLIRTFCMLRCKSDRDCRDAYQCVDLGRPNAYGAVRVETKGSAKVCVAKRNVSELPRQEVPPGVCEGNDGVAEPAGGAGAAGVAGAAGIAGAAGE